MKLTKLLLEYPGAFTTSPDDERKKNREDFRNRKDPLKVVERYIENGSVGDLDIGFKSNKHLDFKLLTSLPDNLNVRGNMYLYYLSNLKELPKNLTVEGSLYILSSGVREIPADIKVGETLGIMSTEIERLPENFTFTGNLVISSCPRLKQLPNNLTINGYLDLQSLDIYHLPENLTVNGSLRIMYCTYLKDLPTSLVVRDDLIVYCPEEQRIKIPADLEVGGEIIY